MYVYPNTKFLWPQLLLNSWIDMDLKKYIQILEKMKLKKIGTFWVYMILVKILKLPAPPPRLGKPPPPAQVVS